MQIKKSCIYLHPEAPILPPSIHQNFPSPEKKPGSWLLTPYRLVSLAFDLNISWFILCLASFSQNYPCENQTRCCVYVEFIRFHCPIVFHCMNVLQCIYPSEWWWTVAWSPACSSDEYVAMNILARVPDFCYTQEHISPGYILGSRIAGPRVCLYPMSVDYKKQFSKAMCRFLLPPPGHPISGLANIWCPWSF